MVLNSNKKKKALLILCRRFSCLCQSFIGDITYFNHMTTATNDWPQRSRAIHASIIAQASDWMQRHVNDVRFMFCGGRLE